MEKTVQGDDPAAGNRVPDARRPAKREPDTLALGVRRSSVRGRIRCTPPGRPTSCCTTDRRTPTARSTSATRSTRSSRTSSSSRRRWRLLTRPMPGLGLPRPADRMAGREEVGGKVGENRDAASSGSLPRVRRPNRSTCSAATSSASACSATGTTLPHHGLPGRGRRDPRAGEDGRQRPPARG